MKWGPWNFSSLRILTSAVLLLHYPLNCTFLSVFHMQLPLQSIIQSSPVSYFSNLIQHTLIYHYFYSVLWFHLSYLGLFSFVPLTFGSRFVFSISSDFSVFCTLNDYTLFTFPMYSRYTVLLLLRTASLIFCTSDLSIFCTLDYPVEVIFLIRPYGWPMLRCRPVLHKYQLVHCR